MRLVQVKADGSFSLGKYEGTSIPPYAILSHTWGNDGDEITYDDIQNKTGREKIGYAKLTFCATQVAKDSLKHFWIDTCCIDKSSSAELSEAITSMFRWYKNSDRCYVYLTDVTINKRKADQEATHSTWMSAFQTSRWFTRGWTLQELLAPRTLSFFSREEKVLGNKLDLAQQIHEITRIPVSALQGASLHEFSIEERMSWAADRETKREEDKAYSLLGIFGVSMVANYGEEEEAAFRRLRREIRETTGNDTTLLDEEEKELFMSTLRFDQIDARHTTIKNAHAKTCKWLFDKLEYIDWLDTTRLPHHHGFLWIKGKPGTGKSTLMKFAFCKARKTMKRSVVIAFFFNARGEVLEKSVIGMYRSLLLQLLEQVPSLRCTFRSSSLSTSSINANYQWGINSLEAQLEQAVLGLGDTPVVFFIDALDECEQRQVRNMVSFFENLGELAVSSGKSFRVCFSSRHYPEITIKKGLSFELEGQEGHTQDIDDYIASELRIGDSEIAQEAKAELQRKASGVFMWVVLVVEILQKEYNRGRMDALKQRLQEIPDDLHQLFYEILTRDSCDKEALILSIQWVLFAKQPLTPGQLYLAILSGVEPKLIPQWNNATMPEEDTLRRFILDSSKGLTEITKSKSQKVQFIHESVRDFLLKDNGLGRIWPHLSEEFEGQSHERLKRCCSTLMRLDLEGRVQVPSDFEAVSPQEFTKLRAAVSRAFPILEYAVQNILHHADAAQGAGTNQQDFMASFLLQKQKWVRFANLFERHKIRRYTSSVSIIYILADRNMPNLIRCYVSHNTCFDAEAERYGVPFLAAIATKSKEAVCAFIDVLNRANGQGKLSPESYVHFYQNENGQSLLPRDFKYSKTRNVVDYLVDFRDKAILRLAITTNAISANARLEDGSSLLTWAIKNGYRDLVELMLNTDKVDVNATDGFGCPPLVWATRKADTHIVELLLSDENVDVNASNGFSLMHAAQNGDKEIVGMLLRCGKANINARGAGGMTALIISARQGLKDIVELLLRHSKTDVNSKDENGRCALSWAALGERSVHPYMLAEGPLYTEFQGYQAQPISPRQLSRRHGLMEKAKMSFEWPGRKPQPDYEAVIELLLGANGVDVNSTDDDGCTPLFWATMNGRDDLVELLLNNDRVDIVRRDFAGFTALDLALDNVREKWAFLIRKTRTHRNTEDEVL